MAAEPVGRRLLTAILAVLRGASGVKPGQWPGPEEAVRFLVMLMLCKRVTSKLRDHFRKMRGLTNGDSNSKEVVRNRGQQFTLTAGSPADLTWYGAIPSYVLPAAFGAESFLIWLRLNRGFMADPLVRTLRLLAGVFAVFPFAECFIAHDWSNPQSEQLAEGYKKDLRFRGSLFAWAAVEAGITYNCVKAVLDPRRKHSLASKAAAAVLLGVLNGGLGITVAHELLHKPRKAEKFVAKALLTNVCYLHWAEEHLVGHHANVATPHDPATARQGESLYAFLPRTLKNSFISSWRLYAERLRQEGKTPSKFTFAMETFGPPTGWVFLLSALTGRRLRDVAPFYLLQAACSIGLLEAVNYIEHYGLQRKQLEDGSYEPVNPRHSWNSAHQLSNTILFKLQRHSDHHTFPQRPFQLLRNFEESPQLPTGYLGMVVLAMCPPAFFWIMDPLVNAHNANCPDMRALDERAAAKYRWWSAGVLAGSVGSIALLAQQLGLEM